MERTGRSEIARRASILIATGAYLARSRRMLDGILSKYRRFGGPRGTIKGLKFQGISGLSCAIPRFVFPKLWGYIIGQCVELLPTASSFLLQTQTTYETNLPGVLISPTRRMHPLQSTWRGFKKELPERKKAKRNPRQRFPLQIRGFAWRFSLASRIRCTRTHLSAHVGGAG